MSYDCPDDDCDGEGFASIHSLRAHVNASDDHDDWSTVSEEISHPSDSDGGSGPESSQKGTEASEKSASGSKEDAGEDMDVETALDKQRGNDGDSGSESNEEGAEASEKTGSAGISIPVDSTTLIVGLGAVVAVVVLWSYLDTGGSDDDGETEIKNNNSDGPDDPDSVVQSEVIGG